MSTHSTLNNIAIIGAGPVGCILAAHIRANKQPVTLVESNAVIRNAIAKNGIAITGVHERHAHPTTLLSHIAQLKEIPPSIIFVATKTWVNNQIIQELKKTNLPSCTYVIAQNGLDNELSFQKVFGKKHVARMVIQFAGIATEPGKITMTFFDPPNILANVRGVKSISRLLCDANLPVQITNDIRQHTWRKTIFNSAMNILCARDKKTIGNVLINQKLKTELICLMKEGMAVAKADGYPFESDFIKHAIMHMEKGKNHKPSMLQDIEAGHPTEIEFFSQKIIEIGKRHGICTKIYQYSSWISKQLLGTQR